MIVSRPATEAGTSSRNLVGIEVARGIAASLVVLYHAARHVDKNFGAPLLKEMLQFGHAGVDLFFVISGFIILHVHYNDIGNPSRLSRYMRRRCTRLLPTYWVALAVTILMALAGGNQPVSFLDIFLSVSLLPSNRELILTIAWTLRFEILFYVLFGVLIANRGVGLAMLFVWFAASAICTLLPLRAEWLPVQFYDTYNLEFLMGMAVAYALRHYPIARPRVLFWAGALLIAIAALLEDLGYLSGYVNVARFAYGIPSAMLILAIAVLSARGAMAAPALLRVLGSASYSIYLFQFVFIGIVWHLLIDTGLDQIMPRFAQFALLASVALIGAVLTSMWVEHPLIRWLRGPRQARPADPGIG